MRKILLFIAIILSSSFSAQKTYKWLKINRLKVATLNDTLKENSGLTFYKNRLFTINDSGNTAEIFEISHQTAKLKSKLSTHLKNIDWEAVTSDSSNIYVGDFGNNSGTRKDLKIYKIPSDSLFVSASHQYTTEIPFFYPEQKDFSPRNLHTDFDTEAMIFLDGKLHLFTKEWSSKMTTHYIIDPAISENQAAQKSENFALGYLATDAAFFEGKLYIVGYTKTTEVFLTIFSQSKPGIFFEEKPRKYYLGSALSIGQIEGIAVDKKGIYLSGEELVTPLGKAKPQLYLIPHEKLK